MLEHSYPQLPVVILFVPCAEARHDGDQATLRYTAALHPLPLQKICSAAFGIERFANNPAA